MKVKFLIALSAMTLSQAFAGPATPLHCTGIVSFHEIVLNRTVEGNYEATVNYRDNQIDELPCVFREDLSTAAEHTYTCETEDPEAYKVTIMYQPKREYTIARFSKKGVRTSTLSTCRVY